MNVKLQRGVVTLLRVVEVNEEEDVSPDVMFVVDVVIKALQHPQTCLFASLYTTQHYLYIYLLDVRPNRPYYEFCPSVPLSVRLSRTVRFLIQKRKRAEKPKLTSAFLG